MLTSNNADWRMSVRIMRILSPIAMIASIILAILSWQVGNTLLLITNIGLFIIGSFLTYIQWCVFSLQSTKEKI